MTPRHSAQLSAWKDLSVIIFKINSITSILKPLYFSKVRKASSQADKNFSRVTYSHSLHLLCSYIISLNIQFFSWTNSSWVIVSVLKQPFTWSTMTCPFPNLKFQCQSSFWPQQHLRQYICPFTCSQLLHSASRTAHSFVSLPFQLHLLGITVGSSSPS